MILIDDGSNDDTLSICHTYAASDPRVKVIHKENGGHTSARNEGLRNSSGEYVIFLDSDDWLEKDVLEICQTDIAENHYPDIIVFRIYNTFTKKNYTNNIPDGLYHCHKGYDEILGSLLLNESGSSTFIKGLIGKAFKKIIIEDNQMTVPHELRLAEDAAAFVASIIDSTTISVNSNAQYFYFVREGSISHSSDRNALLRLPYMFEYYRKKFNTCAYDFSKQFERYIVAQLYTAALLSIRSGANRNRINSDLDVILKDNCVLLALSNAKFNLKGYKFILKKFILRHRLWGFAKLLDRIG